MIPFSSFQFNICFFGGIQKKKWVGVNFIYLFLGAHTPTESQTHRHGDSMTELAQCLKTGGSIWKVSPNKVTIYRVQCIPMTEGILAHVNLTLYSNTESRTLTTNDFVLLEGSTVVC